MDSPLFESGIVAQPDRLTYKYFAYPGSLLLLPCGKLMAVFTAKKMVGPDEAVSVHSYDNGQTWSTPQTLFGGDALSAASSDLDESYGDPSLVFVDDTRVMAFCVSQLYNGAINTNGGMNLDRTRFWRRISDDGGETFGPIEELPRHKKYYVGMVHHGLRLQNGSLLMGYSWDKTAEAGLPANGEGQMDLVSGALLSHDNGMTWEPGGDLEVNAGKGAVHYHDATNGIAEPAIVELSDGRLYMLGRTSTNNLWQSFSHDGGLSWEAPTASPLESHNCPASLLRLEDDGAILAIYNNDPLHRARLSASLSTDGCQSWSEPRLLAPVGHFDIPEASYPATCELPDGTIITIFCQINSSVPGSIFNIRFVRFNRAYLNE